MNNFDGYSPTWCPGCGNWSIWAALKNTFVNLGLTPEAIVLLFGIGCSGNMNDFLWLYSFHALHGRSIPTAVGIKIADHNLPVVAVVGDGDCYGEGGNHLIHTARGNHDITVVVHDNRVYGLTTGQVAPTAFSGFKAKSTPSGVFEATFNPLSIAIASGATFVAQGFAPDIKEVSDLIAAGIKHRGFSLVNILQPCVTFNKINTYAWYRERIYSLKETDYNPADKKQALAKSMEEEKIPLGVIYQEKKPVYTDSLPQLKRSTLNCTSSSSRTDIVKLLEEFV